MRPLRALSLEWWLQLVNSCVTAVMITPFDQFVSVSCYYSGGLLTFYSKNNTSLLLLLLLCMSLCEFVTMHAHDPYILGNLKICWFIGAKKTTLNQVKSFLAPKLSEIVLFNHPTFTEWAPGTSQSIGRYVCLLSVVIFGCAIQLPRDQPPEAST